MSTPRHRIATEVTARPVRSVASALSAVATAVTVVALLVVADDGRAPESDAAPPPPSGYAHGAAGSGSNGVGGSIAPSPTMQSWPGTAHGGNGGPFSFIGAHYGELWKVPSTANNSLGVGYCVMEDSAGEGAVTLRSDPESWDTGEMARAAALMSSFGGDRVVPYAIDAAGGYDTASGEWQHPSLWGGGEYTRRRHIAVNFGVKMFVEDVSPSAAVTGLKLARDSAVIDGTGSNFGALRNGYLMAQHFAEMAEIQHAVGGIHLALVWNTPNQSAPTQPGTYPLEVHAVDGNGKPVGFVPVLELSRTGIDGARSIEATARVNRSADTVDEAARWSAAASLGWPTLDMAGSMAADPRFALASNPLGADVTDAAGIARFDATITAESWELAFHTQAPTADVSLYAGTGIQGQVTWSGPPQSASVHAQVAPPPTTAPPTTAPPTTAPPATGTFRVRTVLDATDIRVGLDMSGFAFDVIDSNGSTIASIVTDHDGRTNEVRSAPGTLRVEQRQTPPWAARLADGGPITFVLDADTDLAHPGPAHPDAARPDETPDAGAAPHAAGSYEVVYTNLVGGPAITTAARDHADGDGVVDLALGAATIVDTITYTDLVPGTRYVATGELMVRPTAPSTGVDRENSATPSATPIAAQMIPSGIVASTEFVPNEHDGQVEVAFAVPAHSPLSGHTIVVYQQLAIGSSSRVVATHADPAAAEQTIRFAVDQPSPPPDSAPPSTAAPAPSTVAPTLPSTEPPRSTPSSQPAPLARTGSNGTRSTVTAGVSILLLGAALVLAARSSPTPPARRPDTPG